ncbi:LPS translocon maturation chaperone LptM [Candidatus Lariskella endosymbiont of Hedychridium roseum]
MQMKVPIYFFVAILLSLLLQGCGKKGDLVLVDSNVHHPSVDLEYES